MAKMQFTDMVTVYPTIEGYSAMKAKNSGSWFINALCQILDNPKITNVHELSEILDKVSLKLSSPEYRGHVRDCNGKLHDNVVQTSEYTVTGMSRKFYFAIR